MRCVFGRFRAICRSLLAAVLVVMPAASARAAESVAPLLWQPSMNVFRRHAVDADAMFEFYGGVLDFEQLVVVPDAADDVHVQVEIGLTVSDLEQSRAFYGDFVGLEALGAVRDPLFDATKHSFRHGSTIVSLRSFGADLPADTGSGGIQYVVSDVARADRLAKARRVEIDQPLSELASFSFRTIWLDDPDGITNYFAETGASRSGPAP